MPVYHPPLDTPELLPWPVVRDEEAVRWQGLLVGNGASIAVSDGFRYPSLLEVAQRPGLAHRLSAAGVNIFAELATANFELVLGSLRTAGRVARAVGLDASPYRLAYEEIQEALFDAVGTVHIAWVNVADRTLELIRAELRRYRRVYSTNYDLLLYWAMMHGGAPDDFRDYFWAVGGPFDPTDTEIWGRPTVVHFLHGALHLRRTEAGGTFKQNAEGGDLLTQFHTDWNSGVTPLLVSEGSSADKLQTINRSDYLSFVYSRFAAHDANLVVFGNSLASEDDHLVRAINRWGSPWAPVQVAVSVRPQFDDVQVRQEKTRFAHRIPHADIWFYDADTHPLGQPSVRIGP